MPNTHSTLTGLFSDIADAIREKSGSSGTIVADTFPTAIRAIPSGGGGGGASGKKQINFIDYDGTILHSYSASEWAEVTALPANPSHSGLVAQGWNWTKAQIDAQLTALPDGDVWVGQMYDTESGNSEIDITLYEGRLSPYLGISVKGSVEVDWGDNSAISTVTGSSLSTQIRTLHEYATAGDYTIVISPVDDSQYDFCGSSSYSVLSGNFSSSGNNRVYANCVRSVRIAGSVTYIRTYTFGYCSSLASITIPSSVTSIGISAFSNCPNLASITIPSGVTSIGGTVFYNCYGLASIAIPSSVTSIGNSTFYGCYSLATITIPSGVTSIGDSAFYYCYSLASITIPSGVTSIGASAIYYSISLASITIPSNVTSIGTNAFRYCHSLVSIIIPSDVTSIGSAAFQSCYGLARVRFEPTTPPTSGTNAWSNLPTDCVISVPTGTLSAYTSAANYPDSATYTYIEE